MVIQFIPCRRQLVRFLFLTILFSAGKAFASDSLKVYEDSLIKVSNELFSQANDPDKYRINEKFISLLQKALEQPGGFSYAFDSLNTIGHLTSPDKKFRIFNWDIPKNDGTFEYFGFLQIKPGQKKLLGLIPFGKKKPAKIIALSDRSSEIKNAENFTGDSNKWFGMLYYSIIRKKYKGKTYYTLLSWDGNDKISRKKIIDVLTFDRAGNPRFGEDIFVLEKKFPKRVILEYSTEFSVSLKYDKETDMIIYSHLIPPTPGLTGQYQFYGPDFSFDGLKFTKGKWVYSPDVDARNMQKEKEAPKALPKKAIYQPK